MKAPPTALGRTAGCLAAALLLTGCIGVIPYPVTNTVTYGHRLTAADVAFIQPGVTTREDVRAQLGTNSIALPMDRAIAYSWELSGGGGCWWICVVLPQGGVADGGTWEGGWRAFFIAFDETGVVTRFKFMKPATRISLHEHLYAWADGLPPPKPEPEDDEPVVMDFGYPSGLLGVPHY